jgi:hypothetical protein
VLPSRRLAPRRMSYARHHPEFLRLREEGWNPRPGPFPHWANPPNPYRLPSPSRPRRYLGRVIDLIAAACAIAIPVAYFKGYEELAGGFIMVTAGLAYVSSKVKPQN